MWRITSSDYHKWLTPEQYGDRFGLSSEGLARVKVWLASAGFTIEYTARGRDWVAFSGTAEQVQAAFHTSVHRYLVRGETHFAVSTEPSIPSDLKPLVATILGLNDFHPKSMARPAYTLVSGHSLAPGDLAAIYDINPLYQHGLDGSGQTIVIVGQATGGDSLLSDVQQFRSNYGLGPANIQFLTDGTSPPNAQEDLSEAGLDLEWAGAIAPNATLIYVYGASANGAALYAIDQNLAPIVSESFGVCEANVQPSAAPLYEAQAQKGNALGITWIAASGDAGAADCDVGETVASHGQAVNFPASVPEITAVGGTEFNEGNGTYWSPVNGINGGSALGYIPEIAWNDTAFGTGLAAGGTLAATGGGISTYFLKSPWQAGLGSLYGTGRYVPDIALAGSPYHDPYNIVASGQSSQIGGTSAATPVFAGMLALLNQHLQQNGVGNVNSTLYEQAANSPNIFHDIVIGNNFVPCLFGVVPEGNCPGVGYGYGFYSGPGYDLTTGLGSVDAFNLITGWNGPPSNIVPSCTPDPVYEQQPNAQGYGWFYTINLKETAGVATKLTGFTFNGTDYSSQIASYFGSSAVPAFGTISANLQAKGVTVPTTVIFGFTGVDADGHQWSQQISVPFNGLQSSTPPPMISLSLTQLQFSYTVGSSAPASQTVVVSNSGGGTFSWSASSTVSWLTLSSATGMLTVSVDAAGLSSNKYAGTIMITAAGVSNSPQTVSVVLTVNAAPQPALSVSPQALTFAYTIGGTIPPAQNIAIAITGGQTLNWTASTSIPWLNVSPMSGTAASVSVNPAGLASGMYSGTIFVSAGSNSAVVQINLTVSSPPPSLPQPTIAAVVNAANVPGGIPPGTLFTIYGSNLATRVDQLTTFPLPNTAESVTVTVNDEDAPLLYVSPGQINAQMPLDIQPGVATVVVKNGTAASYSVTTTVPANAVPGVLVYGNNHAVAQNYPSYSLNSSTTPAKVGDVVIVYLLGGGPVQGQSLLTTGQATPNAIFPVTGSYSAAVDGATANVQFLGLTSGFAGLYQANVVVPSVAPGDHNLTITIGGNGSNVTLISTN